VFLAGDAAHLTPPFAGQGMNSGLRDAHNLAWKIAAVSKGTIGPALLQSYQQERRDHVRQMIRLALRMGTVMSPPGRWSELLMQTGFLLLKLWPPASDYITQMKYKPQPRFSAGFVIPDGRSLRRSLVGRMLPQPFVIAADGRRALLDDVVGPHFGLLVRTAAPEMAFAALDQPIWDELGVVRVAMRPTGMDPVTLPQGVTVTECDEEFAATLGADRTKVILLRPDRYVAACFALEEAGAVAHALQMLRMRTWSDTPLAASVAPVGGSGSGALAPPTHQNLYG
jgi:3-(3-hydroxy-phenyl)propionate hydroxylase